MNPSSVNLVRSSHTWTEADSAAGFVLRYLTPMRRQLAAIMGSNSEADESLKLLLQHLVSAGFGEYKKGRLRDFLIRGIRSSAKARVAEMPEASRPKINLDGVTLESSEWLGFWRDCLLERAWRALERHEHTNSDMPVYSVLFAINAQPNATTQQLAQSISQELGTTVDEATVDRALPMAKAMFAQLIADEIVETLESPTKDDVKQEINTLGMAGAFSGLSV